MDNFEINKEAMQLADGHSAYALARMLLIEQKERIKLAAHVERLDNELQDKALTDDGVLADAYWSCADMIAPWLGEETGPDTLINSVCGSLNFLIEQWREKKALEQGRECRDLIKQAEALEYAAFNYVVYPQCETMRSVANRLRQQANQLESNQ